MIPSEFQFSQASLQDYETCPRRFQLRYLNRLRWPAIESEPVFEAERLAKLGTDFHHMVRQHLDFEQLPLNHPDTETALSNMVAGEAQQQLREWWEAYQQYRPAILSQATIYPEVTFSVPLRGYRLTARFDVLAVQANGSFTIIDWKTAQRKPKRERLARRIQTLVYPYVLAQSGQSLNGGQPIPPERIRLIYWYPAFPQEPEIFTYNLAFHQQYEERLLTLISHIQQAATEKQFPQVDDPRPCHYCIYRSLCDRGDKAGPLLEMEGSLLELDEAADLQQEVETLDWDQVAAVLF